MLCLALDHMETGLPCLKAANGCLSCDYPENEFASWSRRPGAPKLVEAVFQQIEEAAATNKVQVRGPSLGLRKREHNQATLEQGVQREFSSAFFVMQ